MINIKQLIFRNRWTVLATFALVFIATLGLSDFIFGYDPESTSLKPLIVIIPIMLSVLLYLIFTKRE